MVQAQMNLNPDTEDGPRFNLAFFRGPEEDESVAIREGIFASAVDGIPPGLLHTFQSVMRDQLDGVDHLSERAPP